MWLSEFSSTRIFQSGPLLGVVSGKYYQTLSNIQLFQLWHGSLTLKCRASYKNFQQKWLTKSKPSDNYFGISSRSSVCPCAIINASAFQSRSSHSTTVYEKGVLFSFKWNINKGALRALPLSKHRDDAVCKTKECLERHFTVNNRETAPLIPQAKSPLPCHKNINPEADKKKRKSCFFLQLKYITFPK